MDRADELQGAIPGEVSQPQAGSPCPAHSAEPGQAAPEKPAGDAPLPCAEGMSLQMGDERPQDQPQDTITAGIEPISEAAAAAQTPAAAPWTPEAAAPAEAATAQPEQLPLSESAASQLDAVAAATTEPPTVEADTATPADIHIQPTAVEPAADSQPTEGQDATASQQAAPPPAEAPAEEEKAQQAALPSAQAPAEEKSQNMQWYVLKVQSNREETIREALLKRVKIAGLEKYFGEIIIPTEKVTEVKGGKKRVVTRKLYPGYLVAQMEINDDTWYLVRDTSGIGDFTGAAGRPSPMPEHEVARILAKHEEKSQKQPKLKIAFKPGDQVKIHEGTFENFEGQVESIDETNGRVTVMINIFGRSTPVELEYWQIGAV